MIQTHIDDAVAAYNQQRKSLDAIRVELQKLAETGRLYVAKGERKHGGRRVYGVGVVWPHSTGVGVNVFFQNADGRVGIRDHGYQFEQLEIRE